MLEHRHVKNANEASIQTIRMTADELLLFLQQSQNVSLDVTFLHTVFNNLTVPMVAKYSSIPVTGSKW